jgi:hypothetical protein
MFQKKNNKCDYHWKRNDKKMISTIKIYSLNIKNKKIVNNTFNRLQTQNHLVCMKQVTSFNLFVFVIWMIKDDVRKSRAIMNIRELNKLFVFNTYSVSSQSEIIDDLWNCKYLFVIDVNAFFYQWKVHFNDV